MHCPKCGQQQISEQTRFCSRCGFLLTGVIDLVAAGGVVPPVQTRVTGSIDSPKRRGIKQGVFVFLLTFLVVPLLALLTLALNIEPFPVAVGALLFGVGGILRIVYALLFESGVSAQDALGPASLSGLTENRNALPPSQSIPASVFSSPAAGGWRDTNDLQRQPGSVTDSTTKLLQKEDDAQ